MVCGKEASPGEIIAASANQIVPPEIVEVQKRCHQTFPLGGLRVGLSLRLCTEP